MSRYERIIVLVMVMVCSVFFASVISFAEPKEKDVLAVMKKAADYMMNTVSSPPFLIHTRVLSSSFNQTSISTGISPVRPSKIR